MLWIFAIILLVLWLLGYITATGGALIHVLLVIALILIISIVHFKAGIKRITLIVNINEKVDHFIAEFGECCIPAFPGRLIVIQMD